MLHPSRVNHPRNPQEGTAPAGFKGNVRYPRSVSPDTVMVKGW